MFSFLRCNTQAKIFTLLRSILALLLVFFNIFILSILMKVKSRPECSKLILHQKKNFLVAFMSVLIYHMVKLIGNDQHGISCSLARRPECSKLILHLKNEFLGRIYVCFDISHDKNDLK